MKKKLDASSYIFFWTEKFILYSPLDDNPVVLLNEIIGYLYVNTLLARIYKPSFRSDVSKGNQNACWEILVNLHVSYVLLQSNTGPRTIDDHLNYFQHQSINRYFHQP